MGIKRYVNKLGGMCEVKVNDYSGTIEYRPVSTSGCIYMWHWIPEYPTTAQPEYEWKEVCSCLYYSDVGRCSECEKVGHNYCISCKGG